MSHIVIISPSLRSERLSHRVALFLKNHIEKNSLATTTILDLRTLAFPIFGERLKFQKDPAKEVLDFAAQIRAADGVIVIAPEYNGGYPASLKNVIDLLYDEWYHKPVAISTVSNGNFGGTQVIMQLQFILWKMKALIAPAMLPVPNVSEVVDENGNPADSAAFEKRAALFLKELLWLMGLSHKDKDKNIF